MIPKTRYILIGMLIGILATLSSIALIVLWNAQVPHMPYIPIYPHSSNGIRSIRQETDPNVFKNSGILLDETTTFQTSDALSEILDYYQTAYQREYECEDPETYKTDIRATFVCRKSYHSITTTDKTYRTYSVEITISSSNSSVKTASIRQVHFSQPGDL